MVSKQQAWDIEKLTSRGIVTWIVYDCFGLVVPHSRKHLYVLTTFRSANLLYYHHALLVSI